MNYQLVLWDFDGTLADTLYLALDVYNRLAAERKFKPITDPHAVRAMSMRTFLKAHNIPLYRVPHAFSAFLSELRNQADGVRLNHGIHDAVQAIFGMGIQQGIVSSNSTDNIRRCLETNDAAGCFQYVSGTSRVFGKERRIQSAARTLNVDIRRVLYVGDEIRDIEASRAAGLDVAAVGWGLNSPAALREHHPTYMVLRPEQLVQLLRQQSVTQND